MACLPEIMPLETTEVFLPPLRFERVENFIDAADIGVLKFLLYDSDLRVVGRTTAFFGLTPGDDSQRDNQKQNRGAKRSGPEQPQPISLLSLPPFMVGHVAPEPYFVEHSFVNAVANLQPAVSRPSDSRQPQRVDQRIRPVVFNRFAPPHNRVKIQ